MSARRGSIRRRPSARSRRSWSNARCNASPFDSILCRQMDATQLNRLRWRCRRGLLENDLILARYLDARGATMNADEVAALDRLLDFGDSELWDLLAGRVEPRDAMLRPILAALRATEQ